MVRIPVKTVEAGTLLKAIKAEKASIEASIKNPLPQDFDNDQNVVEAMEVEDAAEFAGVNAKPMEVWLSGAMGSKIVDFTDELSQRLASICPNFVIQHCAAGWFVQVLVFETAEGIAGRSSWQHITGVKNSPEQALHTALDSEFITNMVVNSLPGLPSIQSVPADYKISKKTQAFEFLSPLDMIGELWNRGYGRDMPVEEWIDFVKSALAKKTASVEASTDIKEIVETTTSEQSFEQAPDISKTSAKYVTDPKRRLEVIALLLEKLRYYGFLSGDFILEETAEYLEICKILGISPIPPIIHHVKLSDEEISILENGGEVVNLLTSEQKAELEANVRQLSEAARDKALEAEALEAKLAVEKQEEEAFALAAQPTPPWTDEPSMLAYLETVKDKLVIAKRAFHSPNDDKDDGMVIGVYIGVGPSGDGTKMFHRIRREVVTASGTKKKATVVQPETIVLATVQADNAIPSA